MESSNNDNAEFLLNTLSSFKNNLSQCIKQSQNTVSSFNDAMKELTRPLSKISKLVINNIKNLIEEFKNNQSRIESKYKFIEDLSKNNQDPNQKLTAVLIRDECQLNVQITQKQSQIAKEIELINQAIEKAKKVFESKEFKDLLAFEDGEGNDMAIDNDEDATVSIVSEDENDKKFLNKKRKKENNTKKRIKTKVNKKGEKKLIKKKLGTKEKDILTQLKKKYHSSKYVKKITKTFITRRLNHKIIYEQEFDYSDINDIKNTRIKTSGDKCSYKYVIMCFTMVNNDKIEDLIKYFEEQFKINYFIRRKENTMEIGGKIKDPLLPLIENVFKKPFLKENYNVNQCKIFSYEFYEELINEFDISDSNVKAVFEDKMYTTLTDNWKMLTLVRQFVSEVKTKNQQSKQNPNKDKGNNNIDNTNNCNDISISI